MGALEFSSGNDVHACAMFAQKLKYAQIGVRLYGKTNKKVETFNFLTLVNAADAARNALPAAQQPLTTWGLSNGLLTAYLSSSDTMAMGGDLAYGYSQTGGFASMGLAAAQLTLGSSFGVAAQSLQRPLISAPAVDLSLGT